MASDATPELLAAASFVLAPTGSGTSYGVEIRDAQDAPLAVADSGGVVRGASGEVVLVAELRNEGRRDRVTDARVHVTDGAGRPIGSAQVTKYRVGPRAKKLELALRDDDGNDVARLEPRDGRGDEVAILAGPGHVGTLSVSQVKAGFLRKSRRFALDLRDDMPLALRAVVLGTAVRYDALLNLAASPSD